MTWVAYTRHAPQLWAGFARLVLEAAYEATLCAAVLNAAGGGSNQIFLTLLGGGVFGNQTDWILGAMRRALALHQNAALDVAVVSYGRSNPDIETMIREIGLTTSISTPAMPA